MGPKYLGRYFGLISNMKLRNFWSFTHAMVLSCAFVHNSALANLDLAKKNACMSCHALDKKLVGPAFRDVTQKYSKIPDAANQLALSIKKGGAGKWGPVPMPPPSALSDAEALTLAKWIVEGTK
jgi:cytochrome c